MLEYILKTIWGRTAYVGKLFRVIDLLVDKSAIEKENQSDLTTKRLVLDSLFLGLVYSFVVTLIDIFVLFLVYQELDQVFTSLSIVLLAEGGLGLIAGGFIGMNSPIIKRIEEDFFHIKPRKPEAKNEFEKHARTLISTGFILFIVALLLSAI